MKPEERKIILILTGVETYGLEPSGLKGLTYRITGTDVWCPLTELVYKTATHPWEIPCSSYGQQFNNMTDALAHSFASTEDRYSF